MGKIGPPKIVISTTQRNVREVKSYAAHILREREIPHRIVEKHLEERVRISDSVHTETIRGHRRQDDDPDIIIEILQTVVTVLLGLAMKDIVEWLRSRRGRGHVKYKTIEAARAQAMHELENVMGVGHYELESMRTIGSSYRLIFREIGRRSRFHQFLISKSCTTKDYTILRNLKEASE